MLCAFRLVILCLVCGGVLGCGKEKPEEPAPDVGAERKAALQADIDKAIELLEQEKYAEFFDRYMPAESLALKPEKLSMPMAVIAIHAQTPEFFPDVLEQLRVLDKQNIEFLNEDKTEAQVGVKEAPAFSSQKTNPVPDPDAESVPVLEGFSGDLNEVLAQAVAALEAGNYQEFVEKMYPRAELRAATDSGMRDLLARLKEHPQMVEQMIADLKALQQRTPEYEEQESIATFQIQEEDKPTRNFRFEKQGTWRLANTSLKVRRDMHLQAELLSLIQAEVPGAVWVWSEDHWRLANQQTSEEGE